VRADGEPIRVAHVIETLGVGGAETLLLEVTSRLAAFGFRSRVFPLEASLDLLPEFKARAIEVDPVLVAPRRHPVRCVLRLAEGLRRFAPSLVHTHLYYANVGGRVAARLGGRPRIVTTLHNPDYTFESRPTPLFWAKKALDRMTGRWNDAFVAVSDAVAQDYRRHMSWPNIQVIHNGVDVQKYAVTEGPRDLSVWSGPGPRLLSVGRLHNQKGHRVLLEALAQCKTLGVPMSLAIAGDGPLRGELEAATRALGLDSQVRFLGRREDVRALLGSCEIFVFPSLYEASGIALLEAMACGVPVVASRTGGISEIVTEGISGILVSPGNARELSCALRALASDVDLRRRLGVEARARAAVFDIRFTVDALRKLYGELLSTPPST
jgi:glycosyltransferase involved in cell wall biosynthesis